MTFVQTKPIALRATNAAARPAAVDIALLP